MSDQQYVNQVAGLLDAAVKAYWRAQGMAPPPPELPISLGRILAPRVTAAILAARDNYGEGWSSAMKELAP